MSAEESSLPVLERYFAQGDNQLRYAVAGMQGGTKMLRIRT
jgi:hypothetical protein